jgi:hypothetical protein
MGIPRGARLRTTPISITGVRAPATTPLERVIGFKPDGKRITIGAIWSGSIAELAAAAYVAIGLEMLSPENDRSRRSTFEGFVVSGIRSSTQLRVDCEDDSTTRL